MPIVEIFSRRQKRQRGEFPDVYQYNTVPGPLRVQIVHIWTSSFGDVKSYDVQKMFESIHDVLCREYGIFTLNETTDDYFSSVAKFMLYSKEIENILDVIEISFKAIDKLVRENRHRYNKATQNPDSAIEELNARFREHGVGFQYESGQLIRIDSQMIHSEIMKPALMFLSDRDFSGANEEFISAHKHYRDGNYKECLNDCLKSFESTMKIICTRKNWSFKSTDTAKSLLDIMFSKEFIPNFLQSHFSGLRATLEAGVPTIRNILGGHGQGTTQITVPESMASYALHLTATNVVFLVRAEKEFK